MYDKFPEGYAQSYSLSKAGTLMNMVDAALLANITELSVSGPINGSDLLVINRCANLRRLDLSKANIVAGGAAYYRDNNEEFYSSDDIFGPYMVRCATLDSIAYPRVAEIKDNSVANTGLRTAVVPNTVTLLEKTVSCRNYVFECGEENMLSRTADGKDSSVYGARSIWMGRHVSNENFFSCVSASLESVTIAYEYMKFVDGFFKNCAKIKEIKLPKKLAKVGSQCFAGCKSLERVTVCATVPPVANANSFDTETYKTATLYVPTGTKNAYFFDPVWGMFENIVESTEADSGVSEVKVKFDNVDVYDLKGIRRFSGLRDNMSNALPNGIYIVRQGNDVEKIVIR